MDEAFLLSAGALAIAAGLWWLQRRPDAPLQPRIDIVNELGQVPAGRYSYAPRGGWGRHYGRALQEQSLWSGRGWT